MLVKPTERCKYKVLYLLDANTLIHAKRDYYQTNRVPEFWSWLAFCGQQNKVKIPREIYQEFNDTVDSNGEKDELAAWADQEHIKEALIFNEDLNVDNLNAVLFKGYVSEPTESDMEAVGQDPFLISYALSDLGARCIVTAEVSKPKRKGANRHVPDVCNDFQIKWCSLFGLINELDFTTKWQEGLTGNPEGVDFR